jgi:hypothetical protein
MHWKFEISEERFGMREKNGDWNKGKVVRLMKASSNFCHCSQLI